MNALDVLTSTPLVHPHTVRKRDGRTTQPFDIDKITNAVRKAWQEVAADVDEGVVAEVAVFVGAILPAATVNVEDIQDAVEVALMHAKQFTVAKAYMIYRHERAKARAVDRGPDPVAVSRYIHASKYARYLPAERRREVYAETVARA